MDEELNQTSSKPMLADRVGQAIVYILAGVAIGLFVVMILQAFVVGAASLP